MEGNDTQARCRYCKLLMRASYSVLSAHARTPRHSANVAFATPIEPTSSSFITAEEFTRGAVPLLQHSVAAGDRPTSTGSSVTAGNMSDIEKQVYAAAVKKFQGRKVLGSVRGTHERFRINAARRSALKKKQTGMNELVVVLLLISVS